MAEIESRLSERGLALPDRSDARGRFLPFKIEGGLVFMAGQVCDWNGAIACLGPVLAPGQAAPDGRATATLAEGRKAAEICALNLLYNLRDACDGDWRRIDGVVRLGGFVQCLPGFDRSPEVIDGASDLMIALFGETGRHARTAVGVSGLPGNASVEVDAVISLR